MTLPDRDDLIRLELYKILINLLQYEGQLSWTRSQAFFVANGGLATVLGWAYSAQLPIIFSAFCSMIAIVLNLLWILILENGRYHSYYWNAQLRSIEIALKLDQVSPPLAIYNDLQRYRRGGLLVLDLQQGLITEFRAMEGAHDIVQERLQMPPLARQSVAKLTRVIPLLAVLIWTAVFVHFAARLLGLV